MKKHLALLCAMLIPLAPTAYGADAAAVTETAQELQEARNQLRELAALVDGFEQHLADREQTIVDFQNQFNNCAGQPVPQLLQDGSGTCGGGLHGWSEDTQVRGQCGGSPTCTDGRIAIHTSQITNLHGSCHSGGFLGTGFGTTNGRVQFRVCSR